MTTQVNERALPLTDNETTEVDPPTVPVTQLKSPVAEIRARWKKCKKTEKANFLADPRSLIDLKAFIESAFLEPCYDFYNPKRNLKCNCLVNMECTEDLKEKMAEELLRFALLDYEATHVLVLSWIKYANVLASITHQQLQKTKVCVLIGTNNTLVCKNAIAMLIGWGKKAWRG